MQLFSYPSNLRHQGFLTAGSMPVCDKLWITTAIARTSFTPIARNLTIGYMQLLKVTFKQFMDRPRTHQITVQQDDEPEIGSRRIVSDGYSEWDCRVIGVILADGGFRVIYEVAGV